MYIFVQGGVAVELIQDTVNGVPVVDRYPAAFLAQCVYSEDSAGVGQGWTYSGGVFTAPPGPTLAQAKAAKVAQINAAIDAVRAQIMSSTYPQMEIDTFPYQLAEAQAYTANPALPASAFPNLTPIIAKTGATMAAQAASVLAKAAALSAVGSGVVGQGQAYRNQVAAITSDGSAAGNAAALAAVAAINPVFTISGS